MFKKFDEINLAEEFLGSEARKVMKELFDRRKKDTDNPVKCLTRNDRAS
jgi:hypothetical protein